MKRFITVLLVLCMMLSVASYAEEEKPKSIWDSIDGWVNQAVEDTSNWASQAVEDTTNWVSNAATDAWTCIMLYEELMRLEQTGDYELIKVDDDETSTAA